jgi:hypothetical protein
MTYEATRRMPEGVSRDTNAADSSINVVKSKYLVRVDLTGTKTDGAPIELVQYLKYLYSYVGSVDTATLTSVAMRSLKCMSVCYLCGRQHARQWSSACVKYAFDVVIGLR